MKIKHTTPIDAIRNFYIAEKLLPEILGSKKLTKTILENKLKSAVKKASRLSDEFILHESKNLLYPARYDNYLNSKWQVKEIYLKDCGVWPAFGGLPMIFCKGNVSDTASYIDDFIKNKNKLTLKTSRVLYIENLVTYADIIAKYVPIIVLEDHVIRHKKTHPLKERKFLTRTKYDIDDGNHRAVAMFIAGATKTTALVGKRIYKNPFMYE